MPPKKRRSRRRRRSEDTDSDVSDDEFNIHGKYKYDLADKLRDAKFVGHERQVPQTIAAKDFNMDYIRRSGLKDPLLFHDSPAALKMKMPKSSFSVNDVVREVGAEKRVEAVRVATQDSTVMRLDEFIRKYKSKDKKPKALYNLLSLEFSHTRLGQLVSSPAVLRAIDWVETCWPSELKNFDYREHSSTLYPTVQKYCLMSPAGSWTDFHEDFAGTSVWYHIFSGEKVFWLVEPTEQNLKLFEEWSLSGHQQDSIFFGDWVENCYRATFKAGDTLIIPSGWIHAVYTPADSLVFGGNFLHSFAIPTQMRILETEKKMKIKTRFRYPHLTDMLYFVAAKMVEEALGTCHIDQTIVQHMLRKFLEKKPDLASTDLDQATDSEDSENRPMPSPFALSSGRGINKKYITNLTEHEKKGIPILYKYLKSPDNASAPGTYSRCIKDKQKLIDDLEYVVNYLDHVGELHKHPNEEFIDIVGDGLDEVEIDSINATIDEVVNSMNSTIDEIQVDRALKCEPQPAAAVQSRSDDCDQLPSTSQAGQSASMATQSEAAGSGGAVKDEQLDDEMKTTEISHDDDELDRPAGPGFDPMSSLVPLGHKPLPSMLRRGMNKVLNPEQSNFARSNKPAAGGNHPDGYGTSAKVMVHHRPSKASGSILRPSAPAPQHPQQQQLQFSSTTVQYAIAHRAAMQQQRMAATEAPQQHTTKPPDGSAAFVKPQPTTPVSTAPSAAAVSAEHGDDAGPPDEKKRRLLSTGASTLVLKPEATVLHSAPAVQHTRPVTQTMTPVSTFSLAGDLALDELQRLTSELQGLHGPPPPPPHPTDQPTSSVEQTLMALTEGLKEVCQ